MQYSLSGIERAPDLVLSAEVLAVQRGADSAL
jgi:hypothetical protein